MNAQHEITKKLLDVCLELNEQGEYHAHYNYGPHTSAVYIYVLSAQTKYVADEEQLRFIDEAIYLNYSDTETRADEVIEKLRGLMV